MGHTRLGTVWLSLLALTQVSDLWTTGIDRARGAVEALPLTAMLLAEGGIAQLATFKALLLAAAAIALVLTLRWRRRSGAGVALHQFVLFVCRITAVATAVVSLHNAVLFTSM